MMCVPLAESSSDVDAEQGTKTISSDVMTFSRMIQYSTFFLLFTDQ